MTTYVCAGFGKLLFLVHSNEFIPAGVDAEPEFLCSWQARLEPASRVLAGWRAARFSRWFPYLHQEYAGQTPSPKTWGWSYVWQTGPPQEHRRPLLAGLTTIRGNAVDLTDNDPLGTAAAFGHELVHELAKDIGHITPPTHHIMIDKFPETLESSQSPKRLPSNVTPFDIGSIRAVSSGTTNLPQLLTASCD